MIKKMIRSAAGFTLVEMLVVVAIIAILASVFLVGLSGFRQSAYDARRLSDMQKVQTYLEMYYNKHQAYPTGINDWAGLQTALADPTNGVGITSLPTDPAGGGTYYYSVDAAGQSYVLGAAVTAGAAVYKDSLKTLPSGFSPAIPCGDGTANTIYCVKF